MLKKAVSTLELEEMTTTTSNIGIIKGFRSGLEERISRQITEAGLQCIYEADKIKYLWPQRQSTYTPDFKLPKEGGFFYVETKGRFTVSDRQKHLLIQEQCPDIEIRFVFSNANAKLYRGSKTTYAQWCDKHGFMYAHKSIPDDWLQCKGEFADVTE